jgi:hypothetical protein
MGSVNQPHLNSIILSAAALSTGRQQQQKSSTAFNSVKALDGTKGRQDVEDEGKRGLA